MKKYKRNKVTEIFAASDFISDYLGEQMDDAKKCSQDEWLSENEANKEAFDRICSEETMKGKIYAYKNSDAEEAFERFLKTKEQRSRRRMLYSILSGAAIIAITLSIWGIVNKANEPKVELAIANTPENIITNASPRLTLSDGTQINVTEDSQEIIKIQDTEQNYSDTVTYNTLEIPPMCDFQFSLSDGTKVWLNAASTLKYPTTFSNDNRTIYASGEIYLEVAKDAQRPFYVITDEIQLQVLGTAFNIRSYSDEKATAITLSEGKIAAQVKEREYTLTPGKQLELEKTVGKVNIRDVDVDEALAWTKGYYVFKKSRLKDVAHTLQNWYGVTIMMTSEISNSTTYTGVVNKEESLDIFLQRLEQVSNIKCSRNGKSVTIY